MTSEISQRRKAFLPDSLDKGRSYGKSDWQNGRTVQDLKRLRATSSSQVLPVGDGRDNGQQKDSTDLAPAWPWPSYSDATNGPMKSKTA